MNKNADENKYSNYINNYLIKEIAKINNIDSVSECKVKQCPGLDGYMSAIYTIQFTGKQADSVISHDFHLIAKFMKGDHSFRISSHSYIQFANEILFYNEILPYCTAVLKTFGVTPPCWTPIAYTAQYGYIDGLSNSSQHEAQLLPSYPDALLVLENLLPKGYVLGCPMHLSYQHLLTMIRPLADFHAITHILRLRQDSGLQHLIQRIIPLQFKDASKNSGSLATDSDGSFYEVIYRLAFERFFSFFERWKLNQNQMESDDLQLVENVEKLKAKYGDSPIDLLESFRYSARNDDDYQKFAVILHGDFNRTNVLFQYQEGVPVDARLIDFQLLRYGSPAIDLSFFLYMNVDPAMRDELWMKLLEFYHETMLNSVVRTLGNSRDGDKAKHTEKNLESLGFIWFHRHFSRYAFYGVMLCMEVMPWMCSPEEECNRLSFLFENDMLGDEFWKLSMQAGGDDVNWKIFEVMRHASRMGYMDNL